MATITVAQPGLDSMASGAPDNLGLYLKVFAGETITAFERRSVTWGRHLVRTISSGKSVQFPVFGRADAAYLKPGESLDDIRKNIPMSEKVIVIDGLLTTSQVIPDIEEALAHYDVRSEYSKQMGEALALKADGAVLAEVAKMVVAGKENITGLGHGEIITTQLASDDIGVTEAEGKAIVEQLLNIKAKMGDLYVPETERYAFMTPTARTALVASLVAINRDYGAVATITDANVLRVAGFDIIECPHLTIGGAEVNEGLLQGEGHVFPDDYKDKCAFIAMHKSAVGTVKLRDLKLERARRAEYQADMLVASYAMGHGGLRPEAAFMGCIEQAP